MSAFHGKHRELPIITADWLLARVVEREGCLIWQLEAANNGKDPRGTIDKQRFYVRRAIWSAMHDGRQPRSDRQLGITCGCDLCVEPAHIIARTKSEALTGRVMPMLQRARIAETKRKKSNLRQEAIPGILASPLSGAAEAELHGISKDMVNKIRAGIFRRDYNSPFAGLST
jgi:hypothetical protein